MLALEPVIQDHKRKRPSLEAHRNPSSYCTYFWHQGRFTDMNMPLHRVHTAYNQLVQWTSSELPAYMTPQGITVQHQLLLPSWIPRCCTKPNQKIQQVWHLLDLQRHSAAARLPTAPTAVYHGHCAQSRCGCHSNPLQRQAQHQAVALAAAAARLPTATAAHHRYAHPR
jgi:hypothetical protein